VDARARLQALTDFAAPWAIWTAATLRLPDHVHAGATGIDELAGRAGADPDALRRLMAYLVAQGVFEETDGAYATTELSELLRDEAGWRPWLDLDAAPGIWAESWQRLLTAVRTGSPGPDERSYYDELLRTGRNASFDELMANHVHASANELAATFDWSKVARVVDVGGGTGVLLRTLLAAHPHLEGTLFDLPQVVAGVPPEPRLAVVAGDVFVDPIPGGDVYVLSGILHGWPDEDAGRILARLAHATVLVFESVIEDQPSANAASFDLFMLTLVGGRVRSIEDFARLGASCGLAVRATHPLDSGHALVVLSP